jgi:hypothetical protein
MSFGMICLTECTVLLLGAIDSTLIPESTRGQLKALQSVSSRASGGKEYWAEGLRVLGIVEESRGFLRFQTKEERESSRGGVGGGNPGGAALVSS